MGRRSQAKKSTYSEGWGIKVLSGVGLFLCVQHISISIFKFFASSSKRMSMKILQDMLLFKMLPILVFLLLIPLFYFIAQRFPRFHVHGSWLSVAFVPMLASYVNKDLRDILFAVTILGLVILNFAAYKVLSFGSVWTAKIGDIFMDHIAILYVLFVGFFLLQLPFMLFIANIVDENKERATISYLPAIPHLLYIFILYLFIKNSFRVAMTALLKARLTKSSSVGTDMFRAVFYSVGTAAIAAVDPLRYFLHQELSRRNQLHSREFLTYANGVRKTVIYVYGPEPQGYDPETAYFISVIISKLLFSFAADLGQSMMFSAIFSGYGAYSKPPEALTALYHQSSVSGCIGFTVSSILSQVSLLHLFIFRMMFKERFTHDGNCALYILASGMISLNLSALFEACGIAMNYFNIIKEKPLAGNEEFYAWSEKAYSLLSDVN